MHGPGLVRATAALAVALLVAAPALAYGPQVTRLWLVGCLEPCEPGARPVQFDFVAESPGACGEWSLHALAWNVPGPIATWEPYAHGFRGCVSGGVYFLGAPFRIGGPELALEGTWRSLAARCSSAGVVTDIVGGAGAYGLRLQGLAWSDALC